MDWVLGVYLLVPGIVRKVVLLYMYTDRRVGVVVQVYGCMDWVRGVYLLVPGIVRKVVLLYIYTDRRVGVEVQVWV